MIFCTPKVQQFRIPDEFTYGQTIHFSCALARVDEQTDLEQNDIVAESIVQINFILKYLQNKKN
ncbi:hypothetical protein Leryth_002920 [Lithospermum erythrorhizon]|nr:hypothetical protein Leryth_002920 [Lithospermum erythrorhizon]